MNTQEEMTKAIKHAGKYMKKEQDKNMPPIEYCPECMSLKRKPNRDCPNHNSYWINRDDLDDAVDELASLMVKKIANKIIQVQDTHEGKSHQRYWYLRAQEGIRRALKSYKKSLDGKYNK